MGNYAHKNEILYHQKCSGLFLKVYFDELVSKRTLSKIVNQSYLVAGNYKTVEFLDRLKELGFSIGLELPQELLEIVKANPSDLITLRENIIQTLLPKLKEVGELSTKIGEANSVIFHGLDLSLAPYPEKNGSVSELMESLGLVNGNHFLMRY